MFCTYCKKTGGDITRPRRLWPVKPEWEEKKQLLELIKNRDPLSRMKGGGGLVFNKSIIKC